MQQIQLTILVSTLSIGGAEQMLLELLKHINRQKFNIHVLFLKKPGPIGDELSRIGFSMRTEIIRGRWDFSGIFRLATILGQLKTDVLLLINHLDSLFYGPMAALIAGKPVCINWHNETFRPYPLHSFTMFGRRILHLGVGGVIAAARGHKEYLAQVEKIPRRKITVIYNAVDPRRFRSHLSPAEAKKELGLPPDAPVVGIVAALRPDKAHDVFLKAAAMVLPRMPNTHFLIIGDGPMRPAIEALTKQLNIESQVHLLGFQRNLAPLFAAMDVKVLSSRPEQETFSVAALETMSAGIPVVATDVGFLKEMVIQKETGFIVNIGAYREMADRVVEILSNPLLKKRMGEEAKNKVLRNLTIDRISLQFEQLFQMMSKKTRHVKRI